MPSISYKNHRFPPGIIARAVWLYYRLPLNLRLVEEMLLERGFLFSLGSKKPSRSRRRTWKTKSMHRALADGNIVPLAFCRSHVRRRFYETL